ncbi:MAG: hypothetical protein HY664_01800 [Chloroflexi bacterium]|nr:hypothetical protein [Chloroflexota bacterium]
MRHWSKFILALLILGGVALAFGCREEKKATPTPTQVAATPTPTVAAVVGVTKLDVSVGAPPAEGWRWVVAKIVTGDGEVTESSNPGHDFFWEFYVVKGSAEVSGAVGAKTASAGQGILVPAKQEHSHRYLPHSTVLAFDVRSANDNPDRFHGGSRLFLSDKLSLKSTSDHKLRVQEFSLSPGQRMPETTITDANFVYVIEGMLTAGTTTIDTDKANSLPINAKFTLSNEGTTPLRFILVDVRP